MKEAETLYKFNFAGTDYSIINEENAVAGFKNETLYHINIFGMDFGITETINNMWILMGIMIILSVIIRISVNKFNQVPKGIQNFIELLVSGFTDFTKSIMGERNKKFAGFYMAMFLFILASNWAGLFALRNPTADVATTFALSLTTLTMMHGFAIYAKGFKGYLSHFFKPYAFLLPINIIEKVTPGISLAFRLFGNILGGAIILSLCYSLTTWLINLVLFAPLGWLISVIIGVSQAVVLIPLHIFFDIFVGVLQSFIFVVLSMTFVAREMEEEDHEEHKEKELLAE